MATRLPPVHALSAFESAARHASFAVAAEELCITPSALSHRIRLLEEHLCERVFVREGRSVTLTEFGRRYLDVVRVALRTLSDFPLPNKTTQNQLRVKITLPPTFARYMFMPRLASFTKLHPEIEIEIFLFVPLYDLSLSESDVEIRFGAGEYPNLVTKKLFVEPSFAVASPAYLQTLPPLLQPSDLRHATLLRSALEPWQPWFEVAKLDWAEPTTGLRIDDLGLLLEAIKHGHGVGLTRQHFAQELIDQGEVVRLFDTQLATPPHAYYLVHEAQAIMRPEVQVFIDWMQKTYLSTI
ncbi:LysR substrate-binding domain-containing protein [Undibacterium sp. RTI2.1]|uniref:LysR substrate-binding domain-containing protein n=1 Tax=unclassified Undibacterium TaxID=2630295 RepID=UPI002AB54187|nr:MULTISPECIES: LysR substrate-binding domain-containing protein [unclassified Undibacterium]MDY7539118.1 LysR substrate-binding domain-containing protein [Undibacterium sp. 5I1]MEB0030956.1 LysR substrate-binding domain-containing protein [Undibacterium sp. RTI2.1]MEB0115803.1 LysR substrate-binding domain-containing protein [Undibacterium sp. RTI2.2]MEB0229747.1 LysR substrate-binding domain-containing protein [Undibacterium sp. 10I3]MEB0259284.1 LysR substrate-binding domain-containing pro